MSPTLTLPALVAGRDLADLFVDRLDVHAGAEVTVDARQLVSGTSSFAAQLVERLLVAEQAGRLAILGGPDSFLRSAEDAAERLGVGDRLTVRRTFSPAASSAV